MKAFIPRPSLTQPRGTPREPVWLPEAPPDREVSKVSEREDGVVVVIRQDSEYEGDLPVDDIIMAGPWPAEAFIGERKVADAVAYIALIDLEYKYGVPMNGRPALVILNTETFRGFRNIKKIVWDFGDLDEEELEDVIYE